jgi:3-hydroxymyristoyl/3-hydroxydecanoyl-(acyl carrier protein) dehydratase
MRDSINAARRGDPRQSADGATVFEFKFDADDATFAGHFPGRPILPGVYLLEMTRGAAEAVLSCPLAIREIRKAKFQRPIFPDEIVMAELKLSQNDGVVQARAVFSTGGLPTGETILLLWRSE